MTFVIRIAGSDIAFPCKPGEIVIDATGGTDYLIVQRRIAGSPNEQGQKETNGTAANRRVRGYGSASPPGRIL